MHQNPLVLASCKFYNPNSTITAQQYFLSCESLCVGGSVDVAANGHWGIGHEPLMTASVIATGQSPQVGTCGLWLGTSQ